MTPDQNEQIPGRREVFGDVDDVDQDDREHDQVVRVDVAERVRSSTCGECGVVVPYGGRGRVARYCGQVCRQRAYELRRHAAAHGATVPEPRIVREVVDRVEVRTVTHTEVVTERVEVAVPAVPDTGRQWRAMLAQLREQIADPRHRMHREHHQHGALLAAVLDAYTAIDRAHPGGVEAIRGRRT